MGNHKKTPVYSSISILLILFFMMVIPIYVLSQDEVIPFYVATAEGPSKLDPLDAYDTTSIETIMQVCEGLYMYNYSSREMECIPCLAEDMGEWSVDCKNLTVPLKQGVVFHDGTKFNASAVKWNFDRLQYWTYGFDAVNGTTPGDIYTPGDGILEQQLLGTASKFLFKQGNDVILNHTEIIDEYIVRLVLNVQSVIWEKLLAFIACAMVLPDSSYVYGDIFFNRIDLNDELIGTGPFMLTEYEFDNQVIFDYNPDYHKSWGDDHIERMIYIIIPDSVTSSLAFLNHEIHWGGILAKYQPQFDADPDLLKIRKKTCIVYFIQMSLCTMPQEIRIASSFAWNHTHWLGEIRLGEDYELHVPVPEGMQYHHEGFEGEPYYNLTRAREILLYASDSGIAANISANGLNVLNTTTEWRAVAESSTPLAIFNFTRPDFYSGSVISAAATQLQDNLKDIGIKLFILDPWNPWDPWDPWDPERLCYSFGGWGPDYNDPINMIEPLYGTNASSNWFGLQDETWNTKLLATYVANEETFPTREELFYEIQEDFCKNYSPSFYITQRGGSICFNRGYIDEDSVGDLLNIFSDLYWFNVKFTPPFQASPLLKLNSKILFILIFTIGGLIGVLFISTIIDMTFSKRNVRTCSFCNKIIVYSVIPEFCPFCGKKLIGGRKFDSKG